MADPDAVPQEGEEVVRTALIVLLWVLGGLAVIAGIMIGGAFLWGALLAWEARLKRRLARRKKGRKR
jgi:hypothetical protein